MLDRLRGKQNENDTLTHQQGQWSFVWRKHIRARVQFRI